MANNDIVDQDAGQASSASRPSLQQHLSSRDLRQYADRLGEYSKLETAHSLHPGTHFDALAQYIRRPLEAQGSNTGPSLPGVPSMDPFKFATICDLDPKLDVTSPERVQHFDEVVDFRNAANSLYMNSEHGHIVFMRGVPSPEWLLTIGATYQLDPEFFRRHLDFWPNRIDLYLLPTLPSAQSSAFGLRTTVMGNVSRRQSNKEEQLHLQSLQDENQKEMQTYRKKLHRETFNDRSMTGDSIIRECSIHDKSTFSIEQNISLTTWKTVHSWVGFVWLDHGRDLTFGLTSRLASPMRDPYSTWQVPASYIPTVQHRRGIALKPRNRLLAPLRRGDGAQIKVPQSASLLHLDYGRRLDREVAAKDSFYAMHELFAFAASAEAQALNMLHSILQTELEESTSGRKSNPTLTNILYQQGVIDRHSRWIKSAMDAISTRSEDRWPSGPSRVPTEKQGVARVAADSLLRDYEHLFTRCQSLSQQCSRGVQIITHNASIKESREAISQAKEVAKLTQLAFFFIPLSFVTSFFGMNFRQLNSGSLDMWVWLVASVPVFVLSLILIKAERGVWPAWLPGWVFGSAKVQG